MKKIILILTAFLTISCNNDNDFDVNKTEKSESVLISKITVTDNETEATEKYTANFIYENNQLKYLKYDQATFLQEFVYNGNKIMNINYLQGEKVIKSNLVEYEGDLLKSYIIVSEKEKTGFNYENNIIKSEVKLSSGDGKKWNELWTNQYLIESGNIIEETFKSLYANSSTYKTTFTFDSKNNPMRDMNPYLRILLEGSFGGFYAISKNNVISVNSDSRSFKFDIKYDEKEFPIQIKKIDVLTNKVVMETAIEYR